VSWEQTLEVFGGKVWSKSTGEPGTYVIEGLLRCAEFAVCLHVQAYVPGLLGCEQAIGTPIGGGYIQLGRDRQLFALDIPQPGNFYELCKHLLNPPPRRRYGFVLKGRLQPKRQQPIKFTCTDGSHPASFAEFAHLQEPLAVLAYKRFFPCKSREELRFLLSQRWSGPWARMARRPDGHWNPRQ